MAILVPIKDAEIKAEDFGKPVADWINANTLGAWTPVSYASGWSTFPNYQAWTMRKQSTTVQVRGVAMCPALSAGTTYAMGSIPVGFRPPIGQLMIGLCGLYTPGAIRIDLQADGTINVNPTIAVPAGGFVSLSAVYWLD